MCHTLLGCTLQERKRKAGLLNNGEPGDGRKPVRHASAKLIRAPAGGGVPSSDQLFEAAGYGLGKSQGDTLVVVSLTMGVL